MFKSSLVFRNSARERYKTFSTFVLPVVDFRFFNYQIYNPGYKFCVKIQKMRILTDHTPVQRNCARISTL